MGKKLKRLFMFVLTFAMLTVSMKFDVQAAGGLSISASASEVSEGDTFTVTVKGASNYFIANISLSVSGGSVVSGLGDTSLDKGESTSAKIKLTGDTCTVSVSGVGANYDTETEGTASASVSVKKKAVVQQKPSTSTQKPSTSTQKPSTSTQTSTQQKPQEDNRSKDNKLASLSVSEGTMTPAFSSETTAYSVSLPGTATKITLSAKANDAKASVKGTGEKELVVGHNKFTVTCTAENGSVKEYAVDIYVDETPIVNTTFNGKNLGVVRNQSEIAILDSYEPTTMMLEGQEVQVYHSNLSKLTLVYMVNDAGEKNFYICDETGVVSLYNPITILGRNVILYDLTDEEQIRENMTYQELVIDGVTLYGWVYNSPEYANYAHIPVMSEAGEKVIYQYEKSENCLQLYKEIVIEEEIIEEPEVPEKIPTPFEVFLAEYYMYVILGLAALVLILLVTVIVLAATRKTKRNKAKARERRKARKEIIQQEVKQEVEKTEE